MTSIEYPLSCDAPLASIAPVDFEEDIPKYLSAWREALNDPRQHEDLWQPLSQIAEYLRLPPPSRDSRKTGQEMDHLFEQVVKECRVNPQGKVAQILESKCPQNPTREKQNSPKKKGKGQKKLRMPPIYMLDNSHKDLEEKGGEQELLELLCFMMQSHEKNQQRNIERARLLIDQFQEEMDAAQRSLSESHEAEQRLRRNSCYSQIASLVQIALSVGINAAAWTATPLNILSGLGIALSVVGLAPHLLSTWHALAGGDPCGWYEGLSDNTKEWIQWGGLACSAVGSLPQAVLSIRGLGLRWEVENAKKWGNCLKQGVSVGGGALGMLQGFIQADSWRIRAVISEIQAKYEEQELRQITCDHRVKGILEQIKMQRLFGTMKELAELLRHLIDTKDKLLQSEWTKGGKG
ncbi:MAG: hypothetical protein VXZ72_03785 [Chlamydiota bacterium]|nr:hypothetical protein [Chlamydiota bacterium]